MPDQEADTSLSHEKYMKLAIEEAQKAYDIDEVPVGAVLVDEKGNILSTGYNQTISKHDPSAHAEILAIRGAGQKTKNYRFLDTTLYVTIEPCVMCMGAIIHARIRRVVFGAFDPKWGAAGSLYNFTKDQRFNHQPKMIHGVCKDRCRQMLINFFKSKRNEGFEYN